MSDFVVIILGLALGIPLLILILVKLASGDKSKSDGPGEFLCQNSTCRESYNINRIVTVSDNDVMKMLTGGGATVVGRMSGHPILVDHAPGKTSQAELNQFLRSAQYFGWKCNKCQANNSWSDSYRNPAAEPLKETSPVLRDKQLNYYTSGNIATWGASNRKTFDPTEFDPKLPLSSLKYLLDGTLYEIPKTLTSDSCREVVLRKIAESAEALRQPQQRASEAEAAILTVMKLKLSVAVRNSEAWESAESKVDRIIRS